MNHFSRGSCVVAALVSLVACGGGGSADAPTSGISSPASGYPLSPTSCELSVQRSWLRDYMNDQYFWFDRQGSPNDGAMDMAAYLDSLLNKPTDRYSYSQSTTSFTQLFTEGKRTGYGYSLVSPATGVLVVRYVEPLSPVGAAGLKRGDVIVSIDGQSASSILSFGLPSVDSEGIPRAFIVSDSIAGTRSFTVNSAEFNLSPVLDYRMLSASNGRRVGYLAYNDFISSSASALATTIDYFRSNAAQELILDLRYNTGGSTLVAQNLSYLLGGTSLNGQVFAQFQYSAKNTADNFTQYFNNSSYTTPLSGLPRLFVLTSGNTASASEMVINGLRPYLNIVTIGSATFGKPYAFEPRDACGITYNAVNLQITNALGFGDYAAGIAATCSVADDLSRPLGDPLEARVAAALSYVVTGACPSAASREAVAAVSAGGKRIVSNQATNESALGEDGKPQLKQPGAWLQAR
jgi:carboxyl-terminal processing protease